MGPWKRKQLERWRPVQIISIIYITGEDKTLNCSEHCRLEVSVGLGAKRIFQLPVLDGWIDEWTHVIYKMID